MARTRDYGGLGALVDQVRAEPVRVETTCPNHGEPLQVNAEGVRDCPFGDYRVGLKTPYTPSRIGAPRAD